nr:Transposon Ty3-I Gag-Pol polyprotein [Ipomoea batatas]
MRRSTWSLPYTWPGNVSRELDIGKSVKRLSLEEMQRRITRSLFNCNEKIHSWASLYQTLAYVIGVAKLLGYNYEVLYRPGKSNQAVCTLSWCSHRVDGGLHLASPAIMTLSTAHATTWDQLMQEVQSDPYLQKLVTKSLQNPDGSYSMLACDVSERAKASSISPVELLQPLPIPELVWDVVTMDFIDVLPSSNGKTSILVVVDRLKGSFDLNPEAVLDAHSVSRGGHAMSR